ncbi:MAG: AraC family transcriptional regulator, partial [Acidimicrobiales bacterium]
APTLGADNAGDADGASAPSAGLPEELSRAELADMEDAPPAVASPADRVKQAFPGSEEIES